MPGANENIDAVLLQRILDQYRRDCEGIDERLESSKLRQRNEALVRYKNIILCLMLLPYLL